MQLFCIVLLLLSSYCLAETCVSRQYTENSFVCVCNMTYCDTLPQLEPIADGSYQMFSSNKAELRFDKSTGSFLPSSVSSRFEINVDRSVTHQTIQGFGGSFTDAAGINIASLPEEAQDKLLEAYFSKDGSEYSLCRVPIGGTDFSTYAYSLADEGNGTLDAFALHEEDYDYKIPNILKALKITNGSLSLFASAWSAPPWMKTNSKYAGGFLYEEYYQLWADYYINFFDAYQEEGITFWGVTAQNEPATGLFGSQINSNAWTPSLLIKWIKENFGPSVRASSHSNLKIIIHDDQRFLLPFVQEYFADEEALQYIDGVAVHWYADFVFPEFFLDFAKTDKKDIFLLSSEACSGYFALFGLDEAVRLGSWDRAVRHVKYALQDLTHDSIGWIDWNLALDTEGGPTYIDNNVDSPIIINATSGEFYKQPMYYSLSHLSKYIPSGSIRVDATANTLTTLAGIHTAAFERPDGLVSLVLLNEGSEREVVVHDSDKGYATITLTADSINTIVY